MATYSQADSFCVKLFLFILNLVFLVFGLATLGYSVYAWAGTADAGLSSVPSDVIIGGMSIGGSLFIISLFGFGSMRARWSMVVFTLLLFMVIAGQLAVGALAYQKSLNPEQTLTQVWDNLPESNRAAIQTQFDCCGFQNFADRAAVSDNCPVLTSVFKPGCYPRMKQELETKSKIAYITLFSILGVEIVTLVFCFLVLCECCGIYKSDGMREIVYYS